MKRAAATVVIAVLAVARPDPAVAQSQPDRFEAGVQVSSASSSEFDRTDVGFGGRLSWYPVGLLGAESEISFYPRDFPGAPAFSRGRVEGLFGITVGPRFARMRPFASLRPGFLIIREAPRPFACILIFPPPLSCELASGRTLPAVDIGGGIEVFAPGKAFVRADLSDRLLKYPGPVFDSNRQRRDEAFWSHDIRLSVGAGLRF
jgi:hypothetical protein